MRQTFILLLAVFFSVKVSATVHTVTVNSNFFSPSTLTIQLGDTVLWNCVNGCHNVNGTTGTFPTNPSSFGNSVQCAPWTYQYTPTATGSYDYQCDPHAPAMAGSFTVTPAQPAVVVPNAWINEVHYNNAGTDVDEGYEIAGPAGTDLACYKVYRYNGANGALYGTDVLTGTIPDEGCGYGTIWFPLSVNGLQNGDPDGIVLEYAPQATGCGVNNADTLLQLLSYGGTFSATNGRANGQSFTNIGVAESDATVAGTSLQLGGIGTSYSQFIWQNSLVSTHSSTNTNQFFCGAPVSSYRFNPTAVSVAESAGAITLGYVKATNVYAPSQTINVVLKTGSTADINGYNTQTLTFNFNGVDSLPVTVTVTDDALVEGTETLVFALRNASTGAPGVDSLFTLTITDNDVAPPVVQFITTSSTIAENTDSVLIPVSITDFNTNATSVQVMVMGGTATGGVDYSYAPATITFPANSGTNRYLTVYLQNDVIPEGNETVTFMLMSPTNGGIIGANGMHTLTIVDDDIQQVSVAPVLQVEPESVGSVTVNVSLNIAAPTSTNVTLQLVPGSTTATAGTDFIFTDTVITWAANTSGPKTISIPVLDDNLYEFSEDVKLRLVNQTAGVLIADTFATLTILDNDQLTFNDCSDLFFSEYVEGSSNNKALEIYNPTSNSINLADYRVLASFNGGASTGIFQLSGTLAAGDVYVMANNQADSLLKLKADTLTAFINFNGDDALALLHLNDTIDAIGVVGTDPGTSWAVGNGSTADHTLIRNYYTYKGSKKWSTASTQWSVYAVDMIDSLQFHHTAPCGTQQPGNPAVIRFVGTTATVAEGNTFVSVIVETVNPANQSADFVIARDDVASTATAGSDYLYSNQIRSHGQGTTYDTVPVQIYDDALVEQSETVVMRFINVGANVEVGADSVFTLTITDADVLTVGFIGAGFSYSEGDGVAKVRLVLSTPAPDTVRVNVALGLGNATKNSDFLFNDTIVTFLPNSSDTQAVYVTIIDDNIDEGNEQVNFDLSNPTGGAALGITAFTLTIVDNDSTVGIQTIDVTSQIKMYPNPVTGALYLQSEIELNDLTVTDMLGNTVLQLGKLAVGQTRYDAGSLGAGVYFITGKDAERSFVHRFIKAD